MSDRDDFDEKIKILLAKRVGFVCSNPSCGVSTIGPSITNELAVNYIGIAAKVYSASPDNGPRANPKLSSEERKSITNGIHLCSKCANLIDKNKGIDFPAAILLDWKKQAESIALKRFYEYIPKHLWEVVLFNNLETTYLSALTCTSLNERHVKSCPKNEEITKIVKQKLDLSKTFSILGESGTGKSLITYQIAYEYYLEGWDIFRFINENSTTILNRPIPANEKLLLIIDDAQVLDFTVLSALLNLAEENVFLLFNWNASINRDNSFLKRINYIEINPVDQVKRLKDFCLNNKSHIFSIIKRFDENIGEYTFQTSIETKILNAAKENTPWLFNYNLTNGWKQAKYDKNLLKAKNRSDIVITLAALYQIITLDNGIEESMLTAKLAKIVSSTKWDINIIDTINRYCIRSNNRVKLKHYEYARRIISNIVPEQDKTFFNIIEEECTSLIANNEFSRGLHNFLEVIMFNCKPLSLSLKNKIVYKSAIDRYLGKEILNENDIYVVYSLIRSDSEVIQILEKNDHIVKNWFENINCENVVGFSNLVNTLYNNKYSCSFISDKLLDDIYRNMNSSKLLDVYKFSNLLERLQLYLHTPLYDSYRMKYRHIDIDTILSKRKAEDIFLISFITKALYSIDHEASRLFLHKNLEYIAVNINNDPIYGFIRIREIVNNCFGQISIILGGYKKKHYLYNLAKELTKLIQLKNIADSINNMTIRGADTISHLLLLFEMYNKSKLKSLVKQVDFNYIKKLFHKEQKMSMEHRRIFLALYRSNRKEPEVLSYIKFLFEKYKYYPTFLLRIMPDECIKNITEKDDVTVLFEDTSNYLLFGILLTKFIENQLKQNQILSFNRKYVSDAIFSNSINIDNNYDKLVFLDYLLNEHEDYLQQIFDSHDISKLIVKIERLIKEKRNEKKTASLYIEMISRFSSGYNEKLKSIRTKYPKCYKYIKQNHNLFKIKNGKN